jgi:hypothetical protein
VSRQRLVRGQEAVAAKANEITAIPLLLERLELGEGVTAVVVRTGEVALAETDVLKDLEARRQVQAAEARALRQ